MELGDAAAVSTGDHKPPQVRYRQRRRRLHGRAAVERRRLLRCGLSTKGAHAVDDGAFGGVEGGGALFHERPPAHLLDICAPRRTALEGVDAVALGELCCEQQYRWAAELIGAVALAMAEGAEARDAHASTNVQATAHLRAQRRPDAALLVQLHSNTSVG